MAVTSSSLGEDDEHQSVHSKKLRTSGSYASDCSKGSENGNLKTRCNPTEFCDVVSNLSRSKVDAVYETGLGYLLELKVDFLHQPMWSYVVKSIDLKNRSVTICGVECDFNAKEFTRVMGVRDGGREVTRSEKWGKPEEGMLRIFGVGEDVLRRGHLIDIIRNGDTADNVFQIAYALYALSAILCPGVDEEVDITLVDSLIRSEIIAERDWASYAVRHLIEGVERQRSGETDYVAGSMVFLQLMYLDIVGQTFGIVDRYLVPIQAWGVADAEEVLKEIRQRGGFNVPLLLLNGMNRRKTLAEFDNRDGTFGIGIHRAVHEDIYETKAEVTVLASRVSEIADLFQEYAPDYRDLKRIVKYIEHKINSAKDECVARVLESSGMLRKCEGTGVGGAQGSKANQADPLVSKEVISSGLAFGRGAGQRKAVSQIQLRSQMILAEKPPAARQLAMLEEIGLSTPKKDAQAISETSSSPGGNQQHENLAAGMDKSRRKNVEIVPRSHRRIMYNKSIHLQNQQNKTVCVRRFTAGPFHLMRPIQQSDVRLINYVFMGGKETSARENATLVAECGDGRERLVRSALKTLGPNSEVLNEVINFICDFLSRDNPNAWYLPTYFATAANTNRADGVSYDSFKAYTRDVCNMYRFEGRLDTCEMIFIPVHLESGHWWLIVVHIRRRVAELWDSAAGFTGSATARRMARNTLRFLRDVIFVEPLSGTQHPHDFPEYEIVEPLNVPSQAGPHECGIYTIQHMQHYGEVWWEEYDGDEQRSSILLQCMKYPANDSHQFIQRNADDLHFGRIPPEIEEPIADNPAESDGNSSDIVELLGVTGYNPIVNLSGSPEGAVGNAMRQSEGPVAVDVREDRYDNAFECSSGTSA